MAYETKTQQALERSQTALSNLKEKAEEGIRVAKQYLETVGIAVVAGYARGRLTDPADEKSYTLAGIAPELISGTVIAGLGMLGGAGRYAEDAHNVSCGLLGAWGTIKGVEFGVEAREAAKAAGKVEGAAPGTYTIGHPGVGVRGVRGPHRVGVRRRTAHGGGEEVMDGAVDRTPR